MPTVNAEPTSIAEIIGEGYDASVLRASEDSDHGSLSQVHGYARR